LVGLLPGNQDWHITLDYKMFPWRSITVGDHDSIDCWKKYWELIGQSEQRFRTVLMGSSKKNISRYARFQKLRQLRIIKVQKEKT
jgi:hypothetical protein